MIIFLYGEDTYRLNENRDSVLVSYQAKHKSGFNLFRIDGNEPDVTGRVGAALKSVSLFEEIKLVFISNMFADPMAATEIGQLITSLKVAVDPKIVVLATHPGSASSAKPKEVFSLMAHEKNLVRNFEPLAGAKLAQWVKKEAVTQDLVFQAAGLNRFIQKAGTDNWSRANNLMKLANYAQGQPVTAAMVDLLVATETTEPNVFEFIDALGSGRRQQAFALLASELAYGRDPYYLLTMILYQARNMLMIKDFAERNLSAAAIAQKAGIHPFVAKKTLGVVQKFSVSEMKNLFQQAVDLEQGTKQGRYDLEDELYRLTLQ
jgi:DNA polymerase-3 subunit delta